MSLLVGIIKIRVSLFIVDKIKNKETHLYQFGINNLVNLDLIVVLFIWTCI